MKWSVSTPSDGDIPIGYDGNSFDEARKVVHAMIGQPLMPSGWYVHPDNDEEESCEQQSSVQEIEVTDELTHDGTVE